MDEAIIKFFTDLGEGGQLLLILIELFCATFFAGLIGYERECHGHAAGLRTHILVSIGACLIMIVSISAPAFSNLNPNRDPARLAAQVVSGIGFLGAGTIIQNGTDIKGLTTAATLWLCGGIGLAAGSGYFSGALLATLVSLIALTVLTKVELKLNRSSPRIMLKVKTENHVLKDIIELANVNGVEIRDIHSNLTKDVNDNSIYTFYIQLSPSSSASVDTFAEELREHLSPMGMKVYKK